METRATSVLCSLSRPNQSPIFSYRSTNRQRILDDIDITPLTHIIWTLRLYLHYIQDNTLAVMTLLTLHNYQALYLSLYHNNNSGARCNKLFMRSELRKAGKGPLNEKSLRVSRVAWRDWDLGSDDDLQVARRQH
jgi:hypothetical protein